jgi:hypothetical protein
MSHETNQLRNFGASMKEEATMKLRALMAATVLTVLFLFTGILYAASNGDFMVSGNLGVGTTSNPQNRAEIGGSMSVDGSVGIGTTTPTSKLQITDGEGNNGLNIKLFEYAAVGTTYSSWSTVIGNNVKASESAINQMENIVSHPTYAGSAIYLNGHDGITFHTKSGSATAGAVYSSQRMMIAPSGNVGIGTPSPGYLLDVAGQARINGTVYTSDIKFKKQISTLTDSLNKILELNGVSYEWKTDEFKDKRFPEGRHYGVIAQEIEKVLPEVVNTAPDGTKAVAYTEIIPVLIEAIKEQQKEIDELKKQLSHLK